MCFYLRQRGAPACARLKPEAPASPKTGTAYGSYLTGKAGI